MFCFHVIKCFNSLLIYQEIFGLRRTFSFSPQLNTYLQAFYFRKFFRSTWNLFWCMSALWKFEFILNIYLWDSILLLSICNVAFLKYP